MHRTDRRKLFGISTEQNCANVMLCFARKMY